MSTFMNYTFQSFNFRGRQRTRPFFDLIANIAAEEFGHIELVSATINTTLTGASPAGDAPAFGGGVLHQASRTSPTTSSSRPAPGTTSSRSRR